MLRLRHLLLFAATVPVMALAVLRPDRMVVERVVFEGAERVSAAELRHLADVRNGDTIWSIDPAAVSARIQRHPWVASVVVERRFPATLRVEVEEAVPVALLAFEGALYHLDASGRPFARARTDDLDHPVLTGLDAELEQTDWRLPPTVIHDALWLLDTLDEGGLVARSEVSQIAFDPVTGFAIHLRTRPPGMTPHDGPGARVLVGLGDYPRQIRRLAALLSHDLDLSTPVEVDLAPERVAIVRPLAAASSRPSAATGG